MLSKQFTRKSRLVQLRCRQRWLLSYPSPSVNAPTPKSDIFLWNARGWWAAQWSSSPSMDDRSPFAELDIWPTIGAANIMFILCRSGVEINSLFWPPAMHQENYDLLYDWVGREWKEMMWDDGNSLSSADSQHPMKVQSHTSTLIYFVGT